ncbi:MAG: hypothetical protein JST62_03045 [Bacteroidetes bacterium]|nr:hypothetical protein [Bacteroidota bacterium]
MKTLTYLGLTANPDFENNIDNVRVWLVEFDEDNVPTREIGIDENNNVILKMPYKKNYGYWTDNELLYNDFINRFSAVKIDRLEFEKNWSLL